MVVLLLVRSVLDIAPGPSLLAGLIMQKMRVDGSINEEGLLSRASVFLAAFALLLSKVAIEGIMLLFPYPTY